jgi:hypothetical protein
MYGVGEAEMKLDRPTSTAFPLASLTICPPDFSKSTSAWNGIACVRISSEMRLQVGQLVVGHQFGSMLSKRSRFDKEHKRTIPCMGRKSSQDSDRHNALQKHDLRKGVAAHESVNISDPK